MKIKALMIIMLVLTASVAEAVSSRELIDNANGFNGQTVKYKGEAVVAILGREDGSWVNVSDGHNALGIWCKKEMTDSIKYLGDYKTKGDMVEIEGVFNRACPQHGGELDIHAVSFKVTKTGYFIKEAFDVWKLNISAGIFLAIMLLIILFRKRL